MTSDNHAAPTPVTARRASPAAWADRYLTAKREGSHTEATRIYADAIHDLTYQDARTFTELIKEKK